MKYTDEQIEESADHVAKLIADKCGNGMREKYEDVARQIVESLAERQAARSIVVSDEDALVVHHPAPHAAPQAVPSKTHTVHLAQSHGVAGAVKVPDDQPPIDLAAIRDAERYRYLCNAFDSMTSGKSERFLECLGIEGDLYKPLDELIARAIGDTP